MQNRRRLIASTAVCLSLALGLDVLIANAANAPATVAVEFPNGLPTINEGPDATVEAEIVVNTTAPLGAYTFTVACDSAVAERVGTVRGGSASQFSSAPFQNGSSCSFTVTQFQASSLVAPTGKVSVAKFDVHVSPAAVVGQTSPFNVTVVELTDTGALDIPSTDQDGRVNVCVDSSCGSGAIGCPTVPLATCGAPAVPGKSSLSLALGKTSEKDKAKWNWKTGTVPTKDYFGDPTTGTDYFFCVYDAVGGTPTLLIDAVLPAGLGWKSGSTGFGYKNKAPENGITKVKLKAGADGKASVSVGAKGAGIGLAAAGLPLALDQGATAQLLMNGDSCWSTGFGTANRNDDSKFNAHGSN